MIYILYFLTGTIVVINLFIFFQCLGMLYPSKIKLKPITKEKAQFEFNTKVKNIEQELIELGFCVLGYSALTNISMMLLKHDQTNVVCLIYMDKYNKKISYEFYLKSLLGKDIFIASCEMPIGFEHVDGERCRFPVDFTPKIAYLSVLEYINNNALDGSLDTVEKLLFLITDYMEKHAKYLTQRGWLYPTDTDVEYQRVSFKGALVLFFRLGIPTSFYILYKENKRFKDKFM